MKHGRNNKQVSLAGVAKAPKKKKAPVAIGKWICLLIVLIALLLLGIVLYNAFDEEEKPSLTAREMVEYKYTSDKLAGDVSYFLLGITGEDIGDPMDMLSVMCYDRKAGSVSVVQIPVATYIDEDTGFAVDTFGDVWSNPQPLVFCSSCGIRVPEDDRDGKKHVTCGSKLESRTGSATGDLIRVINEQYGLPIDNYLILPYSGLVQLVDAVEGIEVELSQRTTLAGETYQSGVQTLAGEAAAEYAIKYNYKKTPASDRERMLRQRQIIAALWNKLASYDKKDLYAQDKNGSVSGVFGRLMVGANPIRYNSSSFGKARLLGVSESKAAEIKSADTIARFVQQLGKISLDKVTFSILPGETAKRGTARVYSVNRAQTIDLLNDLMNPYGLTLDDETVVVPQVTESPDKADLAVVTLDTMLPDVKQTEGEE